MHDAGVVRAVAEIEGMAELVNDFLGHTGNESLLRLGALLEIRRFTRLPNHG